MRQRENSHLLEKNRWKKLVQYVVYTTFRNGSYTLAFITLTFGSEDLVSFMTGRPSAMSIVGDYSWVKSREFSPGMTTDNESPSILICLPVTKTWLWLLTGTDQVDKIDHATLCTELTIIQKMVALPFIRMHCKNQTCSESQKRYLPSEVRTLYILQRIFMLRCKLIHALLGPLGRWGIHIRTCGTNAWLQKVAFFGTHWIWLKNMTRSRDISYKF